MPIIPGHRLTDVQRQQVIGVFANPKGATDDQWLSDHAFYFSRSGILLARMPVYVIDELVTAKQSQKRM